MKKPPAQAGQSPQNPARKKFHVLRKTGKVLLISLGIIIAIPVFVIALNKISSGRWHGFIERQPAPSESQIQKQIRINGAIGSGSWDNYDFNQLVVLQSELKETELEAHYNTLASLSNAKFGGPDSYAYVYTLPDFLEEYNYLGSNEDEIREELNKQINSGSAKTVWLILINKPGRGEFFN
jgi:hypothetical protein